MVIIDSCFRTGTGIDLWHRDNGMRRECIPVQSQFYLHLPDPHAHREMIDALDNLYPVEICTFRTIFGELPGFRVTAGRDVAEAIEKQSWYSAQLYNVDVRQDQKYLAEHHLACCQGPGDVRFDPACSCDLKTIEITIAGQPSRSTGISSIDITGDETEHIAGSERDCLDCLTGLVEQVDPDVILVPDADAWMQQLVTKARKYGLAPPFSRSGKFRRLDSRSYWTYGRMEHREGALMPDGRILIDTEQSFVYREGGLPGVILASRLTGLSPNLAARFTPGTLISSYEVYEALGQGIAVPFRKGEIGRAHV
jgi:DNA polymerase, archaea type